VEVPKCDAALTSRADEVDGGIERRHCHAHVGWMRRDAMVRRSQNGVNAVEAIDGVTTAAGRAFVAVCGAVVEVIASGALHEVAPSGRHVTKLRGGSREDRLRKHAVSLANQRVCCEVAVPDHGADAHASIGELMDFCKRESRYIDHDLRLLDSFPHEIDKIGPAREKTRRDPVCGVFGDDG